MHCPFQLLSGGGTTGIYAGGIIRFSFEFSTEAAAHVMGSGSIRQDTDFHEDQMHTLPYEYWN